MSGRFALVPAAPLEARDLLDRMKDPEPVPLRLTKRADFFLGELLAAGREGISTINYPGVRVGDAIFKLRKAGVEIETDHVAHGGEFAGSHGVYRLKSRVVRRAIEPAHGPIIGTEHQATP
jgi:hypothetical protein